MAKKKTPAYQVIQDAKQRIMDNAKVKAVKKKVADMTDAEKADYYKLQLSKEKKKYKSLKEKYDILSNFINEKHPELTAKEEKK